MFPVKLYIIPFLLVSLAINLYAQDLTGTWEGRLNKDRFLQLNIVQNGDRICGYTWDYLLKNPKSYCKTYFEGCYSNTLKIWGINAVSFIENSDSSHALLQLRFRYKILGKIEILEYKPDVSSRLLSILNPQEAVDYIYLKKVSDEPVEILEKMKDCMGQDKALKDVAAGVNEPQKLKNSLPVVKIKDSLNIANELKQRKNIEQSRIDVHVKTINLKLYDNAVIDGDIVSILYNGKMLLTHQLLSEKAIEINLAMDENQSRHEIVLFAENLGGIPPNTALIVITAGDKRYELFASASLKENAVLVFDYKPEL